MAPARFSICPKPRPLVVMEHRAHRMPLRAMWTGAAGVEPARARGGAMSRTARRSSGRVDGGSVRRRPGSGNRRADGPKPRPALRRRVEVIRDLVKSACRVRPGAAACSDGVAGIVVDHWKPYFTMRGMRCATPITFESSSPDQIQGRLGAQDAKAAPPCLIAPWRGACYRASSKASDDGADAITAEGSLSRSPRSAPHRPRARPSARRNACDGIPKTTG